MCGGGRDIHNCGGLLVGQLVSLPIGGMVVIEGDGRLNDWIYLDAHTPPSPPQTKDKRFDQFLASGKRIVLGEVLSLLPKKGRRGGFLKSFRLAL